MSEPGVSRGEWGATRVAVYIDFDNIVISRYDQVHGRGQWQRDRVRSLDRSERDADPVVVERVVAATVDVGAVIDYASSFGTLVLTRAYADWSVPVNADYRGQLVSRAVDLVQLFPAAAYAKNGADIRLAVDAVEDMFRLPDLTHVVIVAGDSDYIALAQACRRLGRYVVGVGVAGSTSKALTAACDEFVSYDALPGVELLAAPVASTPPVDAEGEAAAEPAAKARGGSRRRSPSATGSAQGAVPDAAATGEASAGDAARSSSRSAGSSRRALSVPEGSVVQAPLNGAGGTAGDAAGDVAGDGTGTTTDLTDPVDAPRARTRRSARRPAMAPVVEAPEDPQEAASRLLQRALRLGHEKDDAEWLHSSAVKSQMKRMDPSFSEKALGFRSFSDFLKARPGVADLDESSTARLVRLVEAP